MRAQYIQPIFVLTQNPKMELWYQKAPVELKSIYWKTLFSKLIEIVCFVCFQCLSYVFKYIFFSIGCNDFDYSKVLDTK